MADTFDVNAARQAGYSDAEIAEHLRSSGRNPAEQFFYATRPPILLDDPSKQPIDTVRDSQGNPIPVYKFGEYQPAGPEAGRFKLRVPQRPADDDQPYRGITGLVREFSPGTADVLGAIGKTASKLWNDPGNQYLPGPQAVEAGGANLLRRAPSLGEVLREAATATGALRTEAATAPEAVNLVRGATGEWRSPGVFAPETPPVPGQTGQELRSLQRQVLTPAELERAGEFKQEVPGFRSAASYMTPGELQATIAQGPTVHKVSRLLDTLPKAAEVAAAAKMGMPKRGWYRASTQALVDLFGLEDAPRFASLLAAMSPQTSVESNLNNALQTWGNWVRAGRPTDPRAIRTIMGQSVQGSGTEASVLEAWAQNAERALSGRDPRLVTLSGPKVNSFYRNLMDDVYAVTNDTWIANAMGREQAIFGGGATEKGLLQGNPGISPGYTAASVRQRQAGDLIGMQPREVQETYWSSVMALYEKARKLGMTPREVLDRGLLTTEDIRGTPDFSTLLRRDPYANILEQAGYGERLGGLQPHEFPGPVQLTPAEQREFDRTAGRLGNLLELRGRESRATSIPVSGTRPENAFAYATSEYVPGRGTDIFPSLPDQPFDVRKAFSSRMAGAFRGPLGQDVLQESLNLPTVRTRGMTGAWRPGGEIVDLNYPGYMTEEEIARLRGSPGSRQPQEINPGYAAGVEVPVTKRGELNIPQSVQDKLNAAEAARGAMTGQLGSPWNAQIPDPAGASLRIPLEKQAGRDPMGLAAHLVGTDVSLADTARGVHVLNWAEKALPQQDIDLLTGLFGGKQEPIKTTNVSQYIDYAADWAKKPGSRAVTTKMFEYVDKLKPADQKRLSDAMQEAAGRVYEIYNSAAASRKEPVRGDVMRFLGFLKDKGLAGVKSELLKGGVLPAVVLAILGHETQSKKRED